MVALFRCSVLFVSWAKFFGKNWLNWKNRISHIKRHYKKEDNTLSFPGCQAQNKFR